MSEKRKCGWCGKLRGKFSEWEQQTLGLFGRDPEWQALCTYCARRRLNNPLNALLRMRKIGEPNANQD